MTGGRGRQKWRKDIWSRNTLAMGSSLEIAVGPHVTCSVLIYPAAPEDKTETLLQELH